MMGGVLTSDTLCQSLVLSAESPVYSDLLGAKEQDTLDLLIEPQRA